MAVVPATRPSLYERVECVVVPHVSWETYERLLADDAGRRIPRLTFDRGVLELVTPSLPHVKDAFTIAVIVEIVAATFDIPILSAGGTTYRRKDLDRGFEPDASFYIRHEERVRDREQIDLTIDPPPDLVLEMERSRSALKKLTLFARMGIPEVWRCDGERVTILVLEGGRYREVAASVALPALTSDALAHFLAQRRTMLRPEWFRAVTDWARERRASCTIEMVSWSVDR